jgi:hypothetical protein
MWGGLQILLADLHQIFVGLTYTAGTGLPCVVRLVFRLEEVCSLARLLISYNSHAFVLDSVSLVRD